MVTAATLDDLAPVPALLTKELTPETCQRLKEYLLHLEGIDSDDPAYERYIREDVVYKKIFSEQEIATISANMSALAEQLDSKYTLLALFFLCFESNCRLEFDAEQRIRRVRSLLRKTEDKLASLSLFSYAASRYYDFINDTSKRLSYADEASRRAPGHPGFMNNYAEILLRDVEHELMHRSADTPRDLFEEKITDAFERFSGVLGDNPHPIYLVSMGRLSACLGRYDDAGMYFNQAMDAENRQYSEARERDEKLGLCFNPEEEGVFVTEMSEIVIARANANSMRNVDIINGTIASASELQSERAQQLEERIVSLQGRLDSSKVEMLEFLGFFAGVLSFVIATIQIGANLAFVPRALIIVVMLGSLLIAFGAFSILIGPLDAKSTHSLPKATVVIGIGAVLIVGCLAMYGITMLCGGAALFEPMAA